MISLRLEKPLESKLKKIAESKGLTQSAYLRKIIERDLAEASEEQTAWQLGNHLFGTHGSGETNRSENRKSILKAKLRDKQSGH